MYMLVVLMRLFQSFCCVFEPINLIFFDPVIPWIVALVGGVSMRVKHVNGQGCGLGAVG